MRKKTRSVLWVAVLAAVIVAFGFGVHAFDRFLNKGDDGKAEEDREYVYLCDHNYEITHNLESYLIIGADDSGNAEKGDEHRNGLADFLMLAVFDKTDNTYGFLQIDRDTVTRVDMPVGDEEADEDYEQQICNARWYGGSPERGCENTVDAVSELLGYYPIDGYCSLDTGDIGELNHLAGGVTVTLRNDFTEKDPEMSAGKTLKLSDRQAEIFVRSRMDVGDGENRSRMERQREFMKGFRKACRKKMGENADFANEAYKGIKSRLVTDMPGNRFSAMANRMYKGRDLGTFTPEGRSKTGDTLGDGVLHAEFYPSEKSIAKILTRLCSLEDRGKDK